MSSLKNKKYLSLLLIIILFLTLIGLFNYGKVDKYEGHIKINNVNSKLLSSVGNTSFTTSKGYEEVKYRLTYTLDELDGIDKRDVVIEATLNDTDSKYAKFKEINKNNVTSTLSQNGKKIVVNVSDITLGEENYLDLVLIISNAPNNTVIRPSIKIKEATGEFTNVTTESIKVETNSIEGIVRDDNNSPVGNIELSILKNNHEVKRTYTDDSGLFVFTDLEEGEYKIKLEEEIYELISDSNINVKDSSSIELKVKQVENYNIKVNKYINSLRLVVNGKESFYTYEDTEEVVQNVKNARTISGEIEYKIVVNNKGNKEGIVTKVIDEVEDGLSFDKNINTGWEEAGDRLVYRPIEGSTINAKEKREIKLVLTINNTNEIKTYLNKITTKGEIYEKVSYIVNNEVVKEDKVIDGDLIKKPSIEVVDWYTDRNFTNKYNFELPVTKDLILYGKTDEAKEIYRVRFIDDESIIREEEVDEGTVIQPVEVSKTGYTFKFWSLDKNSAYNFNNPVHSDLDLYSVYEAINYNIIYEGLTNTEISSLNNPKKYNIETETITLSNPSNRYDSDNDLSEVFIGWTYENVTTPTINATVPKGSIGDKTFKANFIEADPDIYPIKYNLNDGTLQNDNPSTYTKKTNTFTLNNPTKTGYDFIGWTGSNGNTPEVNVVIEKGTRGELNFVANYTPKVYTITYNLHDGVLENDNPNSYTIESESISLNNPTKVGYTFTGWTGTDLQGKTLNVTIPNGSTGNRNYEANYDINKYTVTFMNEDVLFKKVNDVEYNTTINNPTEKPTKSHNIFVKWLDENNNEFNFSTPITKDITLYASFEEVDSPTISHTPTEWTRDSVLVSITSDHDDYSYMYKIDNGNYQSYTSSFIVDKNSTIYAYSIKQDISSVEVIHDITNIDKINPSLIDLELDSITPTTANVNIKMKDNESGLDKYKVYLNNELLYTSDSFVTDLNNEKESNYLIEELEELTSYTVKVEVIDKVGNISYDELNITTTAKTYVARIIGENNILFEDESDYIKFETLKEAIEYEDCVSSQCTIQMLENVNESNTILQGQDITLDLNGKIVSGVNNRTISNNGKFILNDTVGIGKIYNENGVGIYNTNFLQLGILEEPLDVTTVPTVEGSSFGIETTGTFNFYDGKIIGITAHKGEITQTPYLYNASVKDDTSLEKQVETLEQLAEAEARINSTYYTKLSEAIDQSKNGSIVSINPPRQVDIGDNIVQIGDYPFIYSNGSAISTNHYDNTTSASYIVLDLTNYEENQLLSFDVDISSEGGSDSGYVAITESPDVPNSNYVASGSGSYHNSINKVLQKGKKYYLHMRYSKDYSRRSGTDDTVLSNITLQDYTNNYINELNTNSEYTFVLQEDGYYESNNKDVASLASSYIMYDLTNETEDKVVIVNAYHQGIYGYAYATLTDSDVTPNYSRTEGRFIYQPGSTPKNYIVTIPAGQVSYLHFCYTDGRNNGFFRFSIKDQENPMPESTNKINVYNEIKLNEEVDTVEMLKNITLTSPAKIIETRDVVLDLRGYTLTTNSNDYVVENSGSLKIIDSNYFEQIENNDDKYERELTEFEEEYNDLNDELNAHYESLQAVYDALYEQELEIYNNKSEEEKQDITESIEINTSNFTSNGLSNFSNTTNGVRMDRSYGNTTGVINYNDMVEGTKMAHGKLNIFHDYYYNNTDIGTVYIGFSKTNTTDLDFDSYVSYEITTNTAEPIEFDVPKVGNSDSYYFKIVLYHNSNVGANTVFSELTDLDFVIKGDTPPVRKNAYEKIFENRSNIYDENDYITSGLVAHFDGMNIGSTSGIWEDISGNNNNGTMSNTSTNFERSGILFNGVNSYVEVGEINTPEFTWDVEFKLNSFVKQNIVVANQEAGGLVIYNDANSNILKAQVHVGGSYKSITFGEINAKVPYKATISYDGTTLKGYLDGINIYQENGSPFKYPNSNKPVIIGAATNYASSMNGTIYNFKIYDRALKTDEVVRNYNVDAVRYNFDKTITKRVPTLDASTQTGNITSTTYSVIHNKEKAYLDIESGIVNINRSGSNSAIYNEGSLRLGDYAYVNTLTNGNYGVYNYYHSDILPSTGTIKLSSTNNIGIYNISYDDTNMSGLNFVTTSGNGDNPQYSLYNDSNIDIELSNINITGSGYGIYHTGSHNLVLNDSDVSSVGLSTIMNVSSGDVEINNCDIVGSAVNQSTKKLTINDSTSTISSRSYTTNILNNTGGTIEINNSTISQDYNLNGSYVINNNKGIMNINDSTINAKKLAIINSEGWGSYDATLTLDNTIVNQDYYIGTIAIRNYKNLNIINSKVLDSGVNEVNPSYEYTGIYNSPAGNLNINSSEITSFNRGIQNDGIVNLGDDTDVVNKTTPKITVNNDAVYNSVNGTFNFYDGILTGVKDNAIWGTVNNTPINYDITVTKGDTTETIVLDNDQDRIDNNDYVAIIGSTKYPTLQSAVEAVPDNSLTEIKLLKDFETKTLINIPSTKLVKINYDGHSIKKYANGTYYTNDGELELLDNSGSAKESISYAKTFIENNNKLVINDINEKIINQSSGITNNSLFTLNSGKVYIENSSGGNVLLNNGTTTIQGGELSKDTALTSAVIVNNDTLNISDGLIKTYSYTDRSGYQLINGNNEINNVNISGGAFSLSDRGDYIYTKGNLIVTDGTFDCKGAGGTIFDITSTGTANISGGNYALEVSPKNERFIVNAGTATVEDVNSYLIYGFTNTGSLTLNNVNMKKLSDNWNSTSTGGSLNITGGEYQSSASQVIIVDGTNANFTNASIKSSGTSYGYRPVLYIRSSSADKTVNIDGTTIENNSPYVGGNDDSTLVIDSGNTVNINIINNSNIISTNGKGMINNNPNAIITFGEQGGVPSITNPNIVGTTYGLYNNKTDAVINFYDGIFTGLTNQAIYGSITNLESGYEVLIKDNEDGTESKYLGIEPLLINKETDAEYFDFDTAINEVQSGETLILNRNATILSSQGTINIDSTKNFILDLNGKTISQGNSLLFNNAGTFKITDSSENVGGINTSSSTVINNTGNFIFDKGKIYSELGSFGNLINNSGTTTINEGELSVNVQTDSMINNTGTLNINGGSLNTSGAHENSNMHLINSTTSTSSVNISGGTFTKYSRGDAIYIEGDLVVTGGTFKGPGSRTYGDKDNDCIYNFYIAENATATISGGTYDKITNGMYLINNFGNTTISNIESKFNKGLRNNGTITLNNVIMTELISNYPILNYGTMNINGGNYTLKSSSSLISVETDSITNINNAVMNVESYNASIINDSYSDTYWNPTTNAIINIEGSTLTNPNGGTSNYVLKLSNNTEVNIKDSTLISASDTAIYNDGAATINIGDSTDSVSTTDPVISGKTYGIFSKTNAVNVNIYDGIISGETKAIASPVNNIPSGYNLVTKTDETVDTKYLSTEKIVKNDNTGVEYNTIEDAITNATNGNKLVLLNDVIKTKTQGSVNIESGKEIEFDINSKEITNSTTLFTINGKLTITSDNNSSIYTIGSTIFDNDNELIINGGKYYSDVYFNNVIVNDGTSNINDGIFNTNVALAYYDTSNNMIINNNTMNILGGEYTFGGSGSLFVNEGTLNISNGTFNGTGYSRNGSYYDITNIFTNNGTTNITGGTFASTSTSGRLLNNTGIANIGSINTNNINTFISNSSAGEVTCNGTTITGQSRISNSGRLILDSVIANFTIDYGITSNTNSYTEINNSDLNTTYTNIINTDNSGNNIIIKVNSSNLTSTGTTVPYSGSSNQIELNAQTDLSIDNSNLNAYFTNIYLHSWSKDTLNIINSTLESTNSTSITVDSSQSIINIGSKGGVPCQSNPSIIGQVYGINNSGGSEVYFYDGIIKGKTNSIYGTITDVEPGYKESRSTEDPYLVSKLEILGDSDIFAIVNSINFGSLQSAVNYAVANEIPNITLYRSCELTSNLVKPEGIDVNIILGGNTITTNGYTIDEGINLISSTGGGAQGAISRFLANITRTEINPKNIIIYELEDGTNLLSNVNYKLYKLMDDKYKIVKINELNIGEYEIGKEEEILRTIKGKIYINGIGEGTYKLVGSDNKEINFEIYTDDVSSNIRINNSVNNSKEASSIATLILSLQTGIVRSPYILLTMLLIIVILLGIIVVKNKNEKKYEN